MSKFKLPKSVKSNNNVTVAQLRSLIAKSNGHRLLKQAGIDFADASLQDAIKDAKIQSTYFQLTCKANPTVSRIKLAELFYNQMIKQYESIGYGQGAYLIVPMIALSMGGVMAEFFNSIQYVEINR